jgi:hypothetical protein
MCEPRPLALVLQAIRHGAVTTSVPIIRPSTSNVTPAMPPSSVASATIVTVPDTVASSAGLVMRTTGSVTSATGDCPDNSADNHTKPHTTAAARTVLAPCAAQARTVERTISAS